MLGYIMCFLFLVFIFVVRDIAKAWYIVQTEKLKLEKEKMDRE